MLLAPESITFGAEGTKNRWPLLVHPPGSWYARPRAVLAGVENLYLAGDYVQTTTDLASMEGANESGRLAVNGLLERCGQTARAEVFPIREDAGALVNSMKEMDRQAFHQGKPWRPLLSWKGGDDDVSAEDAVRYEQALIDLAHSRR